MLAESINTQMRSTNTFQNLPGIYIITNNLTMKSYIGQSIRVKNRIAVHRSACSNLVIATAIRKYGVENFTFNVLLYCEIGELDYYEKNLIAIHNTISPSGYNIAKGGHLHKSVSDETRTKMSNLMKGRYTGESNPFYGKKHSIETKKKISDTHAGKIISEEHRRIVGESGKLRTGAKNPAYGKPSSFKGRTHSEESRKMIGDAERGVNNHMSIPVEIKGVRYVSIQEASTALGIPTTTLGYRIRSSKPKHAEYVKLIKER